MTFSCLTSKSRFLMQSYRFRIRYRLDTVRLVLCVLRQMLITVCVQLHKPGPLNNEYSILTFIVSSVFCFYPHFFACTGPILAWVYFVFLLLSSFFCGYLEKSAMARLFMTDLMNIAWALSKHCRTAEAVMVQHIKWEHYLDLEKQCNVHILKVISIY